MTRKDIGLTVGGILATMAVSYLIYRMEKRDAAQAASSQDAAAQAAAVEAEQQQGYLQSLGAVSVPAYQGITSTTGSGTSTSVDVTTAPDPHTLADLLAGFSQQMANESDTSIFATLSATQPTSQSFASVNVPGAADVTGNRATVTGNTATPIPGVRKPYSIDTGAAQ